jgi:hypothetical protein
MQGTVRPPTAAAKRADLRKDDATPLFDVYLEAKGLTFLRVGLPEIRSSAWDIPTSLPLIAKR